MQDPPVSSDYLGREKEIAQLFARVLPLIDATLVKEYRLSPGEALELECSIYDWFHRFTRRPGSVKSVKALRPTLALMVCQAGHLYWVGKEQDGPLPRDEALTRTLSLGPEEIAIELEKRLEDQDGGSRRPGEEER